jgi:hypothetical protein
LELVFQVRQFHKRYIFAEIRKGAEVVEVVDEDAVEVVVVIGIINHGIRERKCFRLAMLEELRSRDFHRFR